MARDVAFEYFHVLYRLKDFVGEVRASDDPDEPPVPRFDWVYLLWHFTMSVFIQVDQQVYKFYQQNTRTIEILRNDHLLRVHFFDKFATCH